KGILSLEGEIEEVDDEFVKKGVLLAVDGIDPEVINDIMNAEIMAMEERHYKGRAIIEKCGEYAPAWGMIGTLVGLVLMLNNLQDPESRSEEHTSELQSRFDLVCRLLLEKKKKKTNCR